ncbi:siphovirus Gp157 family protein [Bacillus testis]|uniref:siphovirus Gp157 family protein n=1 Tax=Bacillus testis TaxID=1622072 RepID=UPI00067E8CAD|nr:siphovirus Gp157 family protein [Bacillus testis]
MSKLYELTQGWKYISENAADLDPITLRDTLDAIEEAIDDKAENTAKLIRSLQGDIEAIKAEEKRLAERRKALENRVDSIKLYLQNQMEAVGLDKVKRPTVTVSIQNNPPSINVVDESLIPSEYMIPQPAKISKKDILSCIKGGGFVPGAEMTVTKGVRIR